MKSIMFSILFFFLFIISCKSQNKNAKDKSYNEDNDIELFPITHMIDENGMKLQYLDNGKKGFKDLYNKIIIPTIYQEAEDFSEGLASVKLNDKWGFIDKNGNNIIPYQYESVQHFKDGTAYVCKKSKWGKINKLGEIIIPFIYDYPYDFKEGLAIYKKGDKVGFIDKKNNIIIPPIYTNAHEFHNGLAFVGNESYSSIGDYQWIDKNNNIVIFLERKKGYTTVSCLEFKEVPILASYNLNNQIYNFYNFSGKIINTNQFDKMGCRFFEGLTWFYKNGLYGYLDKNGNELIPAEYIEANYFYDSLALVKNSNNKLGYIDRNGNTIISFIYDDATNFKNGISAVKLNKYWGAINKSGKVIIPFIHDDFILSSQKGAFLTFIVNGSNLVYNKLGTILPPLFNYTK